MDRRNIFRGVSPHQPLVETGTLAARPSPRTPGRVYVVNATLTATAASGSIMPLAFIDSGSAWIAAESVIFRNAIPTTITGSTQKSVLSGGITTTGSRIKPGLKGGVLGTGHAIEIRVDFSLTASGAAGFTSRLKYGTATVVSRTLSPAGTHNYIHIFNISARNTATGQLGTLFQVVDTAAATATRGTSAIDSTVSQVFDVTIQSSVNQPATSATIRYVSATWKS